MRKKINRRFIPNIFTLLNMYLVFTAIVLIVSGDPIRAAWFVIFAGVLDAFDGKLARLMGIENTFGAEFDSFADTISFCMTSSLLIYTTWVDGLTPLVAIFLSFTPILFGTIRLAKFNIKSDGQPKSYFVGLTTPLYAYTLFGFLLFANQKYGTLGDPRIALAIAIFLGFAMLSPIKFNSIPYLSFGKGIFNNLQLGFGILLVIGTIIWKSYILFPAIILYIVWSIINWVINPNKDDLIENLSTLQTKD